MAENLAKSVSYSELYTYMKCPKKHQLSYVDKLHKVTQTESRRMNLGSIVHYFLEGCLHKYYDSNYESSLEDMYDNIAVMAVAYAEEHRPKPEQFFDGDEWYEIGFDDINAWDKDFQLGVEIAKRTIAHLDIPNKWRIETINGNPIIEYKFEYPLFADRNLVGVIDVVMRSLDDNQIYLIDWKTRQTLLDDFEINAEHISMQLSLYQHVLNSLGVEVGGTITYQIKSSLPTEPYLTEKTHKVARTKGAYDRDAYMAFVEANGENPDDFADMYFPDESYWFRPIQIVRSEVQLHNMWLNAQKIAERMVNDDLAPKYTTPDCVYCPYFKLCLGEIMGLDTEFFIQSNYTRGE